MFVLLSRWFNESKDGMELVRAMEVLTGCVLRVSTQRLNPDGTCSIAEALTFVPGVRIVKDEKGDNTLSPV